jgi:hypothetical protein
MSRIEPPPGAEPYVTIERFVPNEAAPQDDIAELPVVTASSLAGKPAPSRPWHVEGMIPGRQVTLLGGDGGVGKSILAMQLGAQPQPASRGSASLRNLGRPFI